jgi:hypothetical protein
MTYNCCRKAAPMTYNCCRKAAPMTYNCVFMQVADGLRGMQRSLEEAMSAHATAAAAEQKRREAAADAATAARDQRVMREVATEVRPVMTTNQRVVPARWSKTSADGVCNGLSDEPRTE